MKKYLKPLYNGIIKENPTFVLMLGMCPTLAVTTSAMNGTYDDGGFNYVEFCYFST
jgi:Na+-translocating ferredoxin:NAD+ oxidoreductase RnfE subunit